ncbi:glutaredoxin family protein [Anabaena sp. 4-3]|uniref:glutaredoxin family protein n=1 Tax=Anabaena sp. 4-3 TaxID=1811979 RepID=UPI00082F5852|nr:glutaredoxin family protein [Anabaena sp. 4-3]
MQLILYSKPGCHLCEGLQEKLEQIPNPIFELEIRDITTREDWFRAYQYEIPVLHVVKSNGETEQALPRPSPRASVQQLEQMLYKYLANSEKNNAE